MLDNINRNEVFFITYEDVIKSPTIAILKTILLKYAKQFEGFLNFEKINTLDTLDKFYSFFLIRHNKNALEDLAIRKFNYDKSALDVYNKTDDILTTAQKLYFSLSVEILLLQKFTTNIFIWSETYDEKIRLDLINLFGKNEKINYIVGDITKCVDSIDNITCFVINDVCLLKDLSNTTNINNSLVLIANYMYNYIDENNKSRLKLDNIEMLAKENEFKYMLFSPIRK